MISLIFDLLLIAGLRWVLVGLWDRLGLLQGLLSCFVLFALLGLLLALLDLGLL
jgi:hypothetical protein